MATITSTTTEQPAWMLRLRAAKSELQASQESNDLAGYFSTGPESFGIRLQSIQSTDDGAEKLKAHVAQLKAHAGMVKQQWTSFRASSSATDDELKPIGKTLIEQHQETSDHLHKLTNKLRDDKVDKKTAKERLEEGRQLAKKKSSEIIDKAFDAASAAISAMPESQQQKATDVWLAISNGFLSFWKHVLDQFLDMVNAVIKWLAKVWETVKEAWNTVKGIFVEAWNWFSGLF